MKTVWTAYSKAPYFKEAWPLVENVLNFKTNNISELAEHSVVQTCKHLGINTNFEFSSKSYSLTADLQKEKRLIAICNINSAQEYINPIGGIGLYEKKTFTKEGINLSFLKTKSITYQQFNNSFIENLSIIDIMMFNSKHEMNRLLDFYILE